MSEFSDYCLRFPDEATAFASAQALGAVEITEDGLRLMRFTHRYCIDVIGQIVLPATYDADGNELTPPTPLTGWHVNFRILDGEPLPADLQQYVVYPAIPLRIWA